MTRHCDVCGVAPVVAALEDPPRAYCAHCAEVLDRVALYHKARGLDDGAVRTLIGTRYRRGLPPEAPQN